MQIYNVFRLACMYLVGPRLDSMDGVLILIIHNEIRMRK